MIFKAEDFLVHLEISFFPFLEKVFFFCLFSHVWSLLPAHETKPTETQQKMKIIVFRLSFLFPPFVDIGRLTVVVKKKKSIDYIIVIIFTIINNIPNIVLIQVICESNRRAKVIF